jgi:tRNA(Ile)-lysidine synthetase-like protein
MQQVIESLEKHIKNEKVLVAVSTGIDSSVLLDLLLNNKDRLGIEVIVAHVNHQKREQSKEEEKYIREYCTMKKIKCYVKVLPKMELSNFQEWARNERLKFFTEVAETENIRYILFAHHSRDNLETILMRFLRSSGLRGYAGIQEITEYKGKYIYRPLIRTPKDDIIRYAKEQNIRYFEDASNKQDYYTRNRIRKYIIPEMEKENPSLHLAVAEFSETLFEASKVIDEQTNKFIKTNVCVYNNIIKFSQLPFLDLGLFMQREVLFTLLKRYDFSKENIDEIIKQIKALKARIIAYLKPDLTMVKEYGVINFVSGSLETEPFFLKIPVEGTYMLPQNREITVGNNICEFKANDSVICYNMKELPIYIRTKRTGDYIKFKNGTKKVSDILTNMKVSWLLRKDILLLCDSQGDVVEILGYKIRK